MKVNWFGNKRWTPLKNDKNSTTNIVLWGIQKSESLHE